MKLKRDVPPLTDPVQSMMSCELSAGGSLWPSLNVSTHTAVPLVVMYRAIMSVSRWSVVRVVQPTASQLPADTEPDTVNCNAVRSGVYFQVKS